MNIARVGNQDNRTNFNGWIRFKTYGDKIPTKNAKLDIEILEEIGTKLDSVASISGKKMASSVNGRHELKFQETTIWYDDEGGMGIINDKPATLQPNLWEDNIKENSDRDFQIKFREVKLKLGRAINAILNRW